MDIQKINYNLNDPYINCGVLFINVKKWKEAKNTAKCVEILKRNPNLRVADQDAINLLLAKEIFVIPNSYNYNSGFDIYGVNATFNIYGLNKRVYYTKDEIDSKKVIIYHCMGLLSGRPWDKDNWHPQKELFENYLLEIIDCDVFPATFVSNLTKLQRFAYKIFPSRLYTFFHKLMLLVSSYI